MVAGGGRTGGAYLWGKAALRPAADGGDFHTLLGWFH
jgi:hypothetical protein